MKSRFPGLVVLAALLMAAGAPPHAWSQALSAHSGVSATIATDLLFKDGFECAALPLAHIGCEFYAVPLANTLLSPGFTFAVGLVNTSADPASVVITGSGLISPQTLTVASEGVSVVSLPWVSGLQVDSASVRVNGAAYHIVSDRPLAAYQYNPLETQTTDFSYTNDASLLLPVHALSGNYRVVAWPSWDAFPGYFSVVATADGTTVSILATASVLAGGGLSASGGSVTLNRGDVLQVLAPAPGSGTGTYANDLSGSLVTADKPVAVFGGHDASNIPAATGSADHLEEQLPPLESLGADLIVTVPANPAGTARHFVKLVGVENGTQLTYAPSPPAGAPVSLNAGEVAVFEATSHFRLTTSHAPVMVSQYLEGGSLTMSGDPAMGMVVPSSQFRTEYLFVAPTTYDQNWINIVAPAGEPVTLDGAAVSPASFTTITGTGYAVARVQVTATTLHHVAAAAPIGVYVYGYASYTSYLYPAGMGLQGVPVDPAALFPWSGTATDAGDLSVSAGAAMRSTAAGLQAVVNDTNSLFVQDDTPNAESRYRARFYFDPNGFDPGEASGHLRLRILIAFDTLSRREVTLVLRRQSGAYSLEARVRRNDGSRADTGFFPITDAPHFFEFDWQRSTAPGASNGSLQLWIDGVSVAMMSGIDNDQSPIEFVRLGALSVKAGAAGTLFWDEFESRRASYIGP